MIRGRLAVISIGRQDGGQLGQAVGEDAFEDLLVVVAAAGLVGDAAGFGEDGDGGGAVLGGGGCEQGGGGGEDRVGDELG